MLGKKAGKGRNNNAQPAWRNFSLSSLWGGDQQPQKQASSWESQQTNQWDRQVAFQQPGADFSPPSAFDDSLPPLPPPPGSEQRSLVPVSNFQNLHPALPRENGLPVIHTPSLQGLLPALPEDAVYVPPMYTAPRPIIPRYRVISGLISFVIVMLLVCGGMGYFARSSGMLHNLRVWAAGGPPKNQTSTQAQTIPDPKDAPDKGPAYDMIPSATTTTKVNQNNAPQDQARIFKPGQHFFLAYTVLSPKEKGTVTLKWYTNGKLYTTLTKDVEPKDGQNYQAYVEIAFAQPAEGKVEIFLNDKMAQTLYFAIRA
jgi:hypothetical protein